MNDQCPICGSIAIGFLPTGISCLHCLVPIREDDVIDAKIPSYGQTTSVMAI